jgi:NADPH:quinone reductase-like Zn-dependent oxidoreductase
MKAIVQDRFGPPEVLRLADAGVPEVGARDVLVRVHAAALNPADWHIVRGDPLIARLMGVGPTRPKARVAGIDAAGVVKATGANVRGLRNGDQMLGFPGARSRNTRAPRRTWWCPSRRAFPSSRPPRSPSRRRRPCAGSATWAR